MKVIGKILKILGILLLALVLLLAAQAKRLGGSYYLDFAGVSEGGETYTLLHSAMTMGSLGEGYTFLMKLLPQSYRTADIPAELYDAMIFLYSASPITLTE